MKLKLCTQPSHSSFLPSPAPSNSILLLVSVNLTLKLHLCYSIYQSVLHFGSWPILCCLSQDFYCCAKKSMTESNLGRRQSLSQLTVPCPSPLLGKELKAWQEAGDRNSSRGRGGPLLTGSILMPLSQLVRKALPVLRVWAILPSSLNIATYSHLKAVVCAVSSPLVIF